MARVPAGRPGLRVAAPDREPARPGLAGPRARGLPRAAARPARHRALHPGHGRRVASSTSRTSAPTTSSATASSSATALGSPPWSVLGQSYGGITTPDVPVVRAGRPARGVHHRRGARHRRARRRVFSATWKRIETRTPPLLRALSRGSGADARAARDRGRPHPVAGQLARHERRLRAGALRARAPAGLAGVHRTTRGTRSSSSATRSTGCCTRRAGRTASPPTGRRSGSQPELPPEHFTAEHIFPWMFEGPLRATADALAQHEWPRLFDEDVLSGNEVPVAATIYTEDLYLERAFSEQTAATVPELPRLDHQRVRPQRPARRRRSHPRPADRSGPWPRLTCATASRSSRWSTRRCRVSWTRSTPTTWRGSA